MTCTFPGRIEAESTIAFRQTNGTLDLICLVKPPAELRNVTYYMRVRFKVRIAKHSFEHVFNKTVHIPKTPEVEIPVPIDILSNHLNLVSCF